MRLPTIGYTLSLKRTALALCLVLTCVFRAAGQVDRSGIVGVVTDDSGAQISGAAVTVMNAETGLSVKVTTDTGGRYAVTPLQIGTYTVAVEHPGFSKTVQNNVSIDVGQVAGVNLTLRVGAGHHGSNGNQCVRLLGTQSTTRILGTTTSATRRSWWFLSFKGRCGFHY